MIYLGGSISADNAITSELDRRLNESRNAFNLLRKLWSHVSLGISRKLEVFNACITSKVMYALDSAWLLKVGVTRLDAFQCACIRRILKIPPSFISRISNADVLDRAKQIRYSLILHERQIQLYRKIQLMPVGSILRSLVCDVNGCPKNWHLHRNRGRPRQRWVQSVFKKMCTSE